MHSAARGSFRMLRSQIAGVEAVIAQTAHSFPRHTHEHFGIGVIHHGAQRSLSGRGIVEAGPGDVITVNPGEVHDGTPIGGQGRTWRILYFEPALIAATLAELREGRGGTSEFTLPVIADRRIARRCGRLFAAATSGDAIAWDERLLQLLAAVMQERKDSSPPGSIVVARALVDDDPAAPLSLSDLARAAGLSRFQVLRGFVRATGLTPHAYIVQRRIARARRLIARGLPLSQTAVDSGFADQSHMTRVFTRTYGYSPRVFADAVA